MALIAKIERAEALRNIDGILKETAAIMVARGDLGIEVPLERLALEQKSLVRQGQLGRTHGHRRDPDAHEHGERPAPHRAEATDVANAVLDGADAVMLSEESAVGEYPKEAVAWLDRIARATEPAIERGRFTETDAASSPEAWVAESAVRLATQTHAAAIVTPTHSGRTALLVARHRPRAPVLGVLLLPGDPTSPRAGVGGPDLLVPPAPVAPGDASSGRGDRPPARDPAGQGPRAHRRLPRGGAAHEPAHRSRGRLTAGERTGPSSRCAVCRSTKNRSGSRAMVIAPAKIHAAVHPSGPVRYPKPMAIALPTST